MRTVILAAVAAGLTACAAPWQKPQTSERGVRDDRAYCQAWVRNEMRSHETFARERFHGRAIEAESPYSSRGDRAVDQRLQEADMRRLQDRLFATCMTGLGYERAD